MFTELCERYVILFCFYVFLWWACCGKKFVHFVLCMMDNDHKNIWRKYNVFLFSLCEHVVFSCVVSFSRFIPKICLRKASTHVEPTTTIKQKNQPYNNNWQLSNIISNQVIFQSLRRPHRIQHCPIINHHSRSMPQRVTYISSITWIVSGLVYLS